MATVESAAATRITTATPHQLRDTASMTAVPVFVVVALLTAAPRAWYLHAVDREGSHVAESQGWYESS
jgi:hypothetical protein